MTDLLPRWTFLVVGLLAAACGPAVGSEMEEAGGSGGTTTRDTESSETTEPSETTTTTTTGANSGDDSTGAQPPSSCAAPVLPEVGLEVTLAAYGDDVSGSELIIDEVCSVSSISEDPGVQAETVVLDCSAGEQVALIVRVTYSSANASMPRTALGASVRLEYVSAQFEYSGRWLALRDEDDTLLLGIADGDTPTPQVTQGTLDLSDFFAPFDIAVLDDNCAPAEGSCFAWGEPAVQRFSTPRQSVDIAPLHADTIDGYRVHAGAAWLSDPTSNYSCDGQSDDVASFIIIRQP